MSKKSKILLPEGVAPEEEVVNETPENDDDIVEITYEATESDEECFFLMYYMHMAPSEAYSLKDDHRRWILARFMGQKQMEKEAHEQARNGPKVISNAHGLGGLAGLGLGNLR